MIEIENSSDQIKTPEVSLVAPIVKKNDKGRTYSTVGFVFALLSLITIPYIAPLGLFFGVIGVIKKDWLLGNIVVILSVLPAFLFGGRTFLVILGIVYFYICIHLLFVKKLKKEVDTPNSLVPQYESLTHVPVNEEEIAKVSINEDAPIVPRKRFIQRPRLLLLPVVYVCFGQYLLFALGWSIHESKLPIRYY